VRVDLPARLQGRKTGLCFRSHSPIDSGQATMYFGSVDGRLSTRLRRLSFDERGLNFRPTISFAIVAVKPANRQTVVPAERVLRLGVNWLRNQPT